MNLSLNTLLADLGIGAIVFISTNIDDIFLLAAFFADKKLSYRSIMMGQYLGIALLVLVSIIAALLALNIPPQWVALLGAAPLYLGLKKLPDLWRAPEPDGHDEDQTIQEQEHKVEKGLHSQMLAVASVTIANGGDNIGVYVPLFATSVNSIATYTLTFALMTGIWCAMGYAIVKNELMGGIIRKYGHKIFPLVLITLGIHILSGAIGLIR
jgi:cadmium resistance transport/sequestration family protein